MRSVKEVVKLRSPLLLKAPLLIAWPSVPLAPSADRRRSSGSALVVFASLLILWVPAETTVAPAPAERLFIAIFELPEQVDRLVKAETDRLLDVCKHYGSVCFSRHFTPQRRRVGVLHSSPHSASPVVGHVDAVVKVGGEQYGGLTVGLEIEVAGAATRETWMDTVGDWGYGIYVSGRAAPWEMGAARRPPISTGRLDRAESTGVERSRAADRGGDPWARVRPRDVPLTEYPGAFPRAPI